jgi:hypothetical protein
MPNGSPPPHRPLARTLTAGAGVVGFAFLGAVILYLATAGLLYLRGNICHGNGSFTWCREANIAEFPVLKHENQIDHKARPEREFVGASPLNATSASLATSGIHYMPVILAPHRTTGIARHPWLPCPSFGK